MYDSKNGAVFSPDMMYRYVLWRRWEKGPSRLVVIGLNPSTADSTKDDPTIRRCIGFAKREGLAGLIMLNLFAYRSTDPKALATVADPVGPRNNHFLIQGTLASVHTLTVGAWGANKFAQARAKECTRMLAPLLCFGTTKSGAPVHPLYQRLDAPLRSYPPTRRHA
jgi:hypothetical protein